MSALASSARAQPLERVRGPSRASKRLASAALALLGAAIAARLTAYQLGWTAPPWDPIFGDGSQRVLHSAFSRALPFPDAGLGLLAYLVEIVTLAWGSTVRSRSNPVAAYLYAATAFGLALDGLDPLLPREGAPRE